MVTNKRNRSKSTGSYARKRRRSPGMDEANNAPRYRGAGGALSVLITITIMVINCYGWE